MSFLTISIAGHGFNSAGAAINLFDLSPNYAAPLNAMINTLGTVVGISAPYIAGVLTPNVSFLLEKSHNFNQKNLILSLNFMKFEGTLDGMAIGVLDHICSSHVGECCFHVIRQCENTSMEFTKGLNHN